MRTRLATAALAVEFARPIRLIKVKRFSGLRLSMPAAFIGFATMLDLGGTNLPPAPANPAEADAQAIFSDWFAVGQEIQCAMSAATPPREQEE
jgi:hypothetical protein